MARGFINPKLQILAAMIAIRLCRLSEVQRALQLAQAGCGNRLSVALTIQLAIHRGQKKLARRMLSEIDVDPSRDPWLAELNRGLTAPAACE